MAEATFLGRRMRWLLIAGSGATLMACAAPAPAPPPPPATALEHPAPSLAAVAPPPPAPGPIASNPPELPAVNAASMLAGADRLRALGPAELAQEITKLSTLAPSPGTQMQLALALMQTRIPADGQRAAQTLQRLLAQDTPEARGLHALARLLSSQLSEQRRLEENAERQAHLLRDAQRRIEQLNDRLEALRAIERARPARAAN